MGARETSYSCDEIKCKLLGFRTVGQPRQDSSQISVVNLAGPLNGLVSVEGIAFNEAAENFCEVTTANIERFVQDICGVEAGDGHLQPQFPEKYLKVGNRQGRHVFKVTADCLAVVSNYGSSVPRVL